MKRRLAIFLVAIYIVCLCLPSLILIGWADNGNTIVYVTNTGYAYHRGGCSYLKSKNEITLLEATINGYHPCSRCDPPIFNGVLPEATEPMKDKGSNSSGGFSGNSDRRSSSSTKETESQPDITHATQPNATELQLESSTSQKSDNNGKTAAAVLVLCAVCFLIFLVIVYAIIELYRRKRLRLQKKLALFKETEKKKDELCCGLLSLQTRLDELSKKEHDANKLNLEVSLRVARNSLDIILNSRQAHFAENGYPAVRDGIHPYGGACTIFYSKEAKRYHRAGCRYIGNNHIAVHILQCPRDKTPCAHCHPDTLDLGWMRRCINRKNEVLKLTDAMDTLRDFFCANRNDKRKQNVDAIIKRLNGPFTFSNDMLNPTGSVEAKSAKEKLRLIPERVKLFFSKKVRVHVLDKRINSSSNWWIVDFDTMKVNKHIYTETFIVGVNITKDEYKLHRGKGGNVYMIIPPENVGNPYRIFVPQEKWIESALLFKHKHLS